MEGIVEKNEKSKVEEYKLLEISKNKEGQGRELITEICKIGDIKRLALGKESDLE